MTAMDHNRKQEQDFSERIAALEARLQHETDLRIQAETLLAESEERYRNTLERAPQLVVETDINGCITYANPAAFELLEFPESLYGTHITEFINPQDRERENEIFSRGLAGGKAVILSRVLSSRGTTRYVLNNSVPRTSRGQLDGLVIFGMDVTELQNARAGLEESESRYRALAESAHDFIYLIDSEKRLTYVNRAGAHQFGGAPESLIGKHITDIFPPYISKRQIENINHVLATGQEVYVENQYPFPDSEDVWLSARLVPVRNREGRITAVLGISRDISQHKRAQDALQESEEKYRSLVELASDGICITHNARIQFANRAMADMIGHTPEHAIGKMIFEFVPPDEQLRAMDIFQRRKLDQLPEPTIMETYLRHQDGTDIPVEVSIVRITYQGRIAGHIMIRDITERRLNEQALRESEEKYRSVVELASDGIGITQGRKLAYANPQLAAMLGYSVEEITGKSYHDLLFPEDVDRTENYRAKRIGQADTPGRTEIRLVRRDGSALAVDISTVEITYNARPAGLIIVRDATERMRAQQALRESEEKYRSVVELANDGILISRDTHILFANSQLADMLGYSAPELVGTQFTRYMSQNHIQQLMTAYKAPLDSGRPVPEIFETMLMHRDGSQVNVEISAAIIQYQGQRTGLTFVRNITERKNAEADHELLQQQLMQSQKMEAIGTLAGGMAHDFNNALAVILGTAEVAIRKTEPDDPHFTRYHKIIKASERARHLTMKLLTFARKDKINVQPVSLNALAQDCIDILKQTVSKKILLQANVADSHCIVSADPNQLHQALFNICLNACEAMTQGGALTITTKQKHINKLWFRSLDDFTPGAYCGVSIRDTGPGIAPDVCDKIFDPFFTTKRKGTGLGLSITLGIIRSHGGHIHARSLDTGGAEFLILLPKGADDYDFPSADTIYKDHIGSGEVIMVIDDDKDFTELATEALEMAGFRPFIVPPGPRAVDIFKKHHALVDLIVLDMMMPELDGREMFLACRAIRPDIKVILCSGYGRNEAISNLIDMGVNGFLQKPFSVSDMCEKIDDVLQQ